MGYAILGLAIVLEVTATSLMKVSEGFTKLWPSIGTITGYVLAFGLMALAFRYLPVGLSYAIWAGLGTALIACVGIFAFGESATPLKFAGIALVIAGVVALNLGGAH